MTTIDVYVLEFEKGIGSAKRYYAPEFDKGVVSNTLGGVEYMNFNGDDRELMKQVIDEGEEGEYAKNLRRIQVDCEKFLGFVEAANEYLLISTQKKNAFAKANLIEKSLG